jgi:hypothetical protein
MLIHATLPGQNLKKNTKNQSKNLTNINLTYRNKSFSLEKFFSKRFVIEPGR